MSLSEDELVSRLLAREPRAMTLFYQQYRPALYAAVRRIVCNEQSAEDVLQEALVKVWHSIASYDAAQGRLFTWAARVCCNAAIDYVRTSGFRHLARTASLEDSPALYYPAPAGFVPEHIGVAELLHGLRPDHRLVLELVYLQGYTHQEAASELQVPLATVKTWSLRARSQLSRLRL